MIREQRKKKRRRKIGLTVVLILLMLLAIAFLIVWKVFTVENVVWRGMSSILPSRSSSWC